MKPDSYSTDGGVPHSGCIEDSEIYTLGVSSTLGYINHGRSVDRQCGGQPYRSRRCGGTELTHEERIIKPASDVYTTTQVFHL